MKQQRFAPHGILALNPKAFGLIFDLPEIAPVELTENGVAIVQIRGPLMHHRDFFFDSYEAIKERVAEALAQVEGGTGFVLLSIDSPGGLVSGAFDTARELRKMASEAGVDLYAHVGGIAASASYALASAATWIGASESAMLGSIGVIDTLVDVTAQNVARGINVELVTSGERKADGNPNSAIDDGARLAVQGRVDDLAGMFFELVADHGWGGSAEALAKLEARIVHGADAVRIGLATEIATLAQSIAFASPESMRSGTGATATEQGRYNMAKATTEEDAVASLRKMAESDDDDEARKARAALKALGAEGDDDDDAKGEGDDDAKGEGDDDDDDDADAKAAAKGEGDDDDAKAAAKGEGDDDDDDADAKGASAVALQALAEVHELRAERKQEKRDAERATLLASRPDFAPELVAVLQTAPMAMVRKTCKTLKRGPARAESVAAAATATATVRGAGQGDGNAPRLAPEQSAALSLAMGLTEMCTETVHSPNKMSFGVHRPTAQKGK